MKASLISATLFAASVAAHGNITTPLARLAGPAMAKVCGQDTVDAINADPTIPLEGLTAATPQCNLGLCRGALIQDNMGRGSQFLRGQDVNIKAFIPIPHAGPMNMSIIDTATNTAIGPPLISFDVYADESLPELPANNTEFTVAIPTNLSDTQCSALGDCVLQWFWFGKDVCQTYESCIDFVLMREGSPV